MTKQLSNLIYTTSKIKTKLKWRISKFLLRFIVYYQKPSWQGKNVCFAEPAIRVDQGVDMSL